MASNSRVTRATSVTKLVFLGLSVLETRLRPDVAYATDRQTSDVTRASSLNAPTLGVGHNNVSPSYNLLLITHRRFKLILCNNSVQLFKKSEKFFTGLLLLACPVYSALLLSPNGMSVADSRTKFWYGIFLYLFNVNFREIRRLSWGCQSAFVEAARPVSQFQIYLQKRNIMKGAFNNFYTTCLRSDVMPPVWKNAHITPKVSPWRQW